MDCVITDLELLNSNIFSSYSQIPFFLPLMLLLLSISLPPLPFLLAFSLCIEESLFVSFKIISLKNRKMDLKSKCTQTSLHLIAPVPVSISLT